MSTIIPTGIFGIPPNVNSALNKMSKEGNYLKEIVSPVIELVLSYFQGYHPRIVKKKLDNCLHEIKEKAIHYFRFHDIIKFVHEIDYLLLLEKLATDSVAFFELDPELKDKTFESRVEFDYEGMMTYIGYIDKPLIMHSKDGISCCYIDIKSHGNICVKTQRVFFNERINGAVPIEYPQTMDITINSTAQTSNYSFGYTHYNYTRKCIYGLEVEREDEREDIFKECFEINYIALKQESINAIRTEKRQPANFNEYAVDKPTVYTSNFIEKDLQAYENVGGPSPNGMFGVAIYYNSFGFYPGMDLLKMVNFKIFMKTRYAGHVCIRLEDYVSTYLKDMEDPTYYDYLRGLCSCYEYELRDDIRGLVERFCKHKGFDSNEFFSVEPYVVGDYRLSDPIDFFAKIDPEMRLIILDRSCAGINETDITRREARGMTRSTRGGRSKKNKKSKNRRKTRKQRKTR